MVKVLPKEQWESFFDKLSKQLGSKEIEIEVVGEEIGDQVETKKTTINRLILRP